MKPEQKNQKQFVVYSGKDYEWIYNGKDTITLYPEAGESFKASNTILWRGHTFHVLFRIPTRVTSSQVYSYNIIFNEKIHQIRVVRHYAGGGRFGDNPPVIETDEYYLEISYPLGSFAFKEKLKQKENTSELPKEDIPVKLKDLLKMSDPKKEETETIPDPEDNLIRVCPFNILETSDELKFFYPERIKKNLEFCTDQVTLYENNGNVCINNYAYFDKENFVVDSWKLGYAYEDEYFLVVNKSNVPLLYKEFKIDPENKSKLLIGVLNAFKGKNCFNEYEEFLISKNIPYGGC